MRKTFQHRRYYRADVARDSYERALDFLLAGFPTHAPFAALAMNVARQPCVRLFFCCATLWLGTLCELGHLRQHNENKRRCLEYKVQECLVVRD